MQTCKSDFEKYDFLVLMHVYIIIFNKIEVYYYKLRRTFYTFDFIIVFPHFFRCCFLKAT